MLNSFPGQNRKIEVGEPGEFMGFLAVATKTGWNFQPREPPFETFTNDTTLRIPFLDPPMEGAGLNLCLAQGCLGPQTSHFLRGQEP